jgi:raffinose/stachyose/melibiose transport system permease protein
MGDGVMKCSNPAPITILALLLKSAVGRKMMVKYPTRANKNWYYFLIYIAPAFIMYLIFVLYPIISSFKLSLFDWNGVDPVKTFVGLKNYVALIHDSQVKNAVWKSIYWTLGMSTIPVFLALSIAALLSQNIRGRLLYRTVFYMPVVMSTAAIGVIWTWIYNPFFGIINQVLKVSGIAPIPFLGDPHWVMPSLFMTDTWSVFGFYMVIFLAAIQSIDPSVYDAAAVDGVNKFQEFIYITIPALGNTITLVVTLAIMKALKVFAIIWIMTQGGPYHASETIPLLMYSKAFEESKVGYGSAIAVVFTVIIMFLTVSFRKLRADGND